MELVIGNRNYSSWSLRAWLHLEESGLEFEVRRIPLFLDDWRAEVAEVSPAGRVPVLLHDGLTIWDSQAIHEYVVETFPEAVGWPQGTRDRFHARSIASEMHSGFLSLRDELPQNLKRMGDTSAPALELQSLSDTTRQQIERIGQIWRIARQSARGGPWLFGTFTLADVVYAPVALRFLAYGIELDGVCQEYCETVLDRESVRRWCELACDELEVIDFIDDLVPAQKSPLVLG